MTQSWHHSCKEPATWCLEVCLLNILLKTKIYTPLKKYCINIIQVFWYIKDKQPFSDLSYFIHDNGILCFFLLSYLSIRLPRSFNIFVLFSKDQLLTLLIFSIFYFIDFDSWLFWSFPYYFLLTLGLICSSSGFLR